MDSIQSLQDLIATFVKERNWEDYHTPKNLAMSVAIEAGELMELFQWITGEQAKSMVFDSDELRNNLKDELADVLIYCIALANYSKINIGDVVRSKMERNNYRFPAGNSLPS